MGVSREHTFFDNWKAVICDVGERYGENLDGWFFDDGAVYYPAHFEDLARAARTGNPNRFISYNNVNNVRHTDFQDLTLGERRLSEDSYLGPPRWAAIASSGRDQWRGSSSIQ